MKKMLSDQNKSNLTVDVSLSSLGSSHFILYPSTPAGPHCAHGSSPKPSGQVMGSYQKEAFLLNKITNSCPIYNVCRRSVMIPQINWNRKEFVQIFLFSKYDVVLECGRRLAAKL